MTTINIITSLVTDNCCICLEDKDINYKCITCNEAKLCRKCYIKMRKHNRFLNCPTCREKNWVVEIPPIFYENHDEKLNTLTLYDKINNCCIVYDFHEKFLNGKQYCLIFFNYLLYLLLFTVVSYFYGVILFSSYHIIIEKENNENKNDSQTIIKYWDFDSLEFKYIYIGCLGGLLTIAIFRIIQIPLKLCYKNIENIYISKTTAPVLPYDSREESNNTE